MKRLFIVMIACLLVATFAFGKDYVMPEDKDVFYRALEAYENGDPITDAERALLDSEGVFREYTNELDEMGGPDAYGYMYYDSQEIGGPVYGWVDISETGTMIDNMGDDTFQGPFDLGFTFNYYGTDYDEVYICSNGFLMFGGGSGDLGNDPIPSANTPNNIICFFWDDLNPSDFGSGPLYYGDDGAGNWVCTFDEVEEYGGASGHVTCQTILYQNGEILMQYQDVEDIIDINGETIGIENADGTDGLQVSYNADPVDYPFSELAILFTLGEENASVSGTVTADATGDPIMGAEVHFGGYMATTDDLGYYEIAAMYPRGYAVSIDAAGYYPYTDAVEIVEGANTYDAALMLPGAMDIDLVEINLSASLGETDTQVMTITNTGDSPLVVDISREMMEPEAMGLHAYRPLDRPRRISSELTEMRMNDHPSTDDVDAFEIIPTEHHQNELDEPYVLIFSDALPWGDATVQDHLTLIGVPYEEAGSADMATYDLEPFTVIIILSVQSQAFYDEFEANHDRFEDWVSSGGWLQFHGCTQSPQTWTMFDGLADIYDTATWNYVVEEQADHPILTGIPAEFSGNSNNHNYLVNLPENAVTLIEDDMERPVLIEYSYGSGNMVVTTQTWEIGADLAWVNGDVMYNTIDYTTANAPGLDAWLSIDPGGGVIAPGDFLEVTVTGDATGEDMIEGVYQGVVTVMSDDPDNMQVDLPVTFVVGGQVILTATPWNIPTFVGPNGGSFRWDAYVENISGGTITFDAWTGLTLPTGMPYEPLDLFTGLTLIDGGILMASPNQAVPGFAPPGIYTYHAKVGDFIGGVVLAEATFDFAKLPLPGPAVANGFNANGWILTDFFEMDELGVVEDAGLPTEYSMENAYPNPFNPTTTISVGLPEDALMKVSVYNVVGQEVAVLANGAYNAGYHNLTFNASNLSSGIYFVQASVPGRMDMVQKVMLMK